MGTAIVRAKGHRLIVLMVHSPLESLLLPGPLTWYAYQSEFEHSSGVNRLVLYQDLPQDLHERDTRSNFARTVLTAASDGHY